MSHIVEKKFNKTKIEIVFKNGYSGLFEVDELTVKSIDDQIIKLNWTNSKPKIMFISLADIVAIFEVEVA